MNPVMDLSLPTFHRSMVGTPLGASFFVMGADTFGAACVVDFPGSPVPNMAPSDMVGDELIGTTLAGFDCFVDDLPAGLGACFVDAFVSSSNPKMEESEMVTPGRAFSTALKAFSAFCCCACLVSWIVALRGALFNSFGVGAVEEICCFICCTVFSLKKYLLPEAVCTTLPFSSCPFTMGEVSNCCP